MRKSGRITSANRYKIFVTSDKGWSDIVCTILIVRVIVNMSGFNVQFMRIQEYMV